MSSWKEYKLGELLEITSSKRIMRSEYIERGIPFYRSKEIIELHNNNDVSTEIFISDDTFNKIKDKFGVPKEGDLLLTSVGTLGIPYLVKDTDCFYFKDGNLTWFRNFDSKICSEYLYYWLLSPIGKQKIKDITIGSTQQALTIVSLKSLTINLPDLEIQKYIVDILNSISEKIKNNIKINQTLEQIAQTIFKSWFIDFDPVHAKANALANGQALEQATQAAMAVISGKNTQELHRLQTANPEQYQQLWEIAEAFPSGFDEEGVPRGWESKPLDEIAIYQNGLALQKFRPESEDEYLPVVKIAQLKQGYTDGGEKASVNIKPECIIDNGDVIFSWSGSLVVDIWCGGKAALNQHLFKVTSKNYPKWLYYFYTVHHLAEFQRIAADKAVTMGHIKREHLSQALCVIPNNEFIQKFCFLEDYINQIVNNRLQNFSLRKIRDELLPKLLSGEVV